MPLLSALSEFKDSFHNIANERETVRSRGEPFDDLELPSVEAAASEATVNEPSVNPDDVTFDSLFSGDDSSAPADGNFDFSAFTNAISDPSPPPAVDNITGADIPPVLEETADTHFYPENGSSFPKELLNGLSDELESIPADFNEEQKNESVPEEINDEFNFNQNDSDTMPSFDFDNNILGLGGESFDTDGLTSGAEELDLGGESFDTDGLTSGAEELDLGGESLDTDSLTSGAEELDLGGESLDSGDNDGIETDSGTSDDSAGLSHNELPDFDFSGGDSSFSDNIDMGEPQEAAGSGEFDTSNIVLDGDFDTEPAGDYGSDTTEFTTTGSIAGGDSRHDDFGDSEFNLSGLDEILNKSKADPSVKETVKKKGFWAKRKEQKEFEAADIENEVEEIRLSQQDMDNIIRTLSMYPLNLRIVYEELIAEQVLTPQQLSKILRYLKNNAPIKEAVVLAQEISGKQIIIPKSFEKSTGEALEAERASFAYIFIHNFLPVLRLFAVIGALAASVIFLAYKFIYTPLKAESIYKRGYERIAAGEYPRANQLFNEAFLIHRKKPWFYKYAEGFIDERRYLLAEEKYDELLRYYPRDKKGVLDYAALESKKMMNYEKANRILQRELLDYAPNDREGLLAYGDNNMDWADSDPTRFADKYEDARFAYARLLDKYGWQPPYVERMMRYFIHTDNLKEVLPLKDWFDGRGSRKLSVESLAELGGYLLDKQLEEVKGVPNAWVESIEGVRAMLLQAVREDQNLPEPHYHLARYHHNLGNIYEERLTLENAIRAFDIAKEETVRRRLYRVDTHYRYANMLINNREFFRAEEETVRGINLYNDFLERKLIASSPQLGKLYAIMGDLEYFIKDGNTEKARNEYLKAERNHWAPPEIQYRIGVTFYNESKWKDALDYFFKASADLPLNRKLLFALGNTTYRRGDHYAAQGYYNRLLDILENQRSRLPVLLPNDRPEFLEVGERLMMARNNAGVNYEALADVTGSREYRSRALALYAESSRAWDAITRNPREMTRLRPIENPNAPGINLGFLNANNALHASNIRRNEEFNPEIFVRIDKDVLDPSRWEELAPMGGLIE
ncbi:MAG: tetratricopeptide repeat protein [Treponema sp.]|jgi:tetratricopeptide (TPR) repeat protein|nr:tetratricopeptide repeat protein [Treponema sp.]